MRIASSLKRWVKARRAISESIRVDNTKAMMTLTILTVISLSRRLRWICIRRLRIPYDTISSDVSIHQRREELLEGDAAYHHPTSCGALLSALRPWLLES